MADAPAILGTATAVPAQALSQDAVRSRAAAIFRERPALVEHLAPVYDNAGIRNRYSTVPLDWYASDHGWRERNALYLEHALALSAEAAERCLEKAAVPLGSVDALVAVSTTGIATPSLDALLMQRLGMRRNVIRLPLFGLGCVGGVLGLARAAQVSRAERGCRVLLVVTELCGLTFRRRDASKSNVVATALFGDGAAAVLLGPAGEAPGPVVTVGAAGEHTWPNSLDVMGWEVEDDGLRVIFSRDIPTLIRESFQPALQAFLERHRLSATDFDRFLCHPGGAKVLDALEDVLGLASGALTDARSVLRDYGNMSAASVLFVLDRALNSDGIGRRALMTGLGPGFTAGFVVLETRG
ncbi:MAG: type III polyketide synthase [Rhodospirillales bacterium]|nr:MAG: type III polyketide synthase [Rhodospirillales bacterium]